MTINGSTAARRLMPWQQAETEHLHFGFTPDQVREIMTPFYASGDRLMRRFVLVHFAIGLLLAWFYSTWLMEIAIGGAAVAMVFIATTVLPQQFLTRCIVSLALQVFVALHIYQMHGLAEMHFFFFTASTLMIVYQDWVSMWPGTLLIIGQHTLFAVLHNTGLQLYFFEDPYIGFRKLFFHFSIVIGQAILCGYWSHLRRRQTLQAAAQEGQLRESQTRLTEQLNVTRRSESALRFSEERLQLAQSAAGIGTWDWDIPSDTALCSEEYNQLYGVPAVPFSAFGQWWLARVHREDRDRAAREVKLSLDTRSSYVAEYRVTLPDGTVRWLVARARVFSNEVGDPARMIGVTLDITNRKLTEQALRDANEDLQQFAYAASHDLQEPLRTISSYTKLLARRYSGQLEGDADEFLQFVVKGTERMQGLLKGLLAYCKAGSNTVEREWLCLDEVIGNVKNDLQTAICESGAQVIHGPLPQIFSDRVQVQQLFQNLIANAIRYRSASPPRISIQAVQHDQEWVFAVQDNGVGIEFCHQEQIFGLFKRLHGPAISGSGLGLSICRRIMERHGGRIWVQSEVGRGSTFFFNIPANCATPAKALHCESA